MAILKMREIRYMTAEQRKNQLKKMQKELALLRASVATGGSLEKPSKVKDFKKTVARNEKCSLPRPASNRSPQRFQAAALSDVIHEQRIPRKILRGNPLKWGYQVVVLSQSDAMSKWDINDFLCPEDRLRQKLLRRSILHLSAVRADGR